MTSTSRNLLRRLSPSDATLTLLFIVGLAALTFATGGNMLSHQSILSFFTYLCVPILIGLSQMAVLAVGQLNLAIGAMGGVTTALMAVLMASHGFPVWLGLLVGLVAAAVMGAINGLLVVLTGLNGFIVTLGTMTILIGAQYALVQSFTIDAYSVALKTFGRINVFGVPVVFILTILVAVMVSLFFSRTLIGRRVLATGGSDKAAMLSGISNAASTIWAFALSGALIGVAAIVTMTTLPGINRSIGGDWLLASFAAPIIGGALLTGGTAVVYGTIIAAMLLRLVDFARAQFSLDPSWSNFIIGAVVLGTVAVGEWRKRRHARSQLLGRAQVGVAA